jgi:hypothetical protein
MTEINLYLLPLSKCSTEGCHGRHNAHVFQLRQMQLVRDRLHFRGNLDNAFSKRGQCGSDFVSQARRILLQLFDFHRQHCQALVDVVVKISRDAGTLLLLRLDEPCDENEC